jgi:hypothetical protein
MGQSLHFRNGRLGLQLNTCVPTTKESFLATLRGGVARVQRKMAKDEAAAGGGGAAGSGGGVSAKAVSLLLLKYR